MTTREFDVHNLDCAGCSAKIEAEIANLPEVAVAHLNFMNKRLTVQYKENIQMPLERLNAIADKIEPGVKLSPVGDRDNNETKKPWFIVLSVFILTVSMFMPDTLSMLLGLTAYIIAAHKVIKTSIKELFSRQLFAEHFLMTIATLGALYLGEYTEAAAVMILFEAGQYLESKAINRSRNMVKSMLSLKPEFAHLINNDTVSDVKLIQVKQKDIILVYAGERIPLDGTVIKGESAVDTSSITGESEPLAVSVGSEVFAGFLNSSAILEIEVSSTEADSMISRILNLIEHAGARKSTTEKFITQAECRRRSRDDTRQG